MGNFVANIKLPPSIELSKDWQHARVLCQGRNGCSIRAVCWEQGPWVLDIARIKAHPCLKRVAAMLVFIVWDDEILRPRGHRQ